MAWVFFRAPSTTAALRYLSGIAELQGGVTDRKAILLLALAGAAIVFIDFVQLRARDHAALLDLNPALRGVVYGLMVVAIVIWSGGNSVPFIYFQF